MPGLRTRMGCGVPHFWLGNSRIDTKYTSAVNGVRSLKALPMKSTTNGMLAVVRVWRPGLKVSSALPSRKKTAFCASRTISCEPMRKSPRPVSGTRRTISSRISFGYSMTSNILAIVGPPGPLARHDRFAAAIEHVHRVLAHHHHPLDGAGQVVIAYCRDQLVDRGLEHIGLLEQFQVIGVESFQLLLVNAHRVEEAGVAGGGALHPVRKGPQFEGRSFQLAHLLQLATRDQLTLDLRNPGPLFLKALGHRIPKHTIRLATGLSIEIADKARQESADLAQQVPLLGHLAQRIGHLPLLIRRGPAPGPSTLLL